MKNYKDVYVFPLEECYGIVNDQNDNFVFQFLIDDEKIEIMLYKVETAKNYFIQKDWVQFKTEKELEAEKRSYIVEKEKADFIRNLNLNSLCYFIHEGIEKQCIVIDEHRALVSCISKTNTPYIISHTVLIIDAIQDINVGNWVKSSWVLI